MNKTYIATMGERFFMSKIAIATDSNSGITQAQGRELGIFVMPMPFYINDELFLEDITLSQEQFYQRLEEGADVKTTQPAPGDVLELWDRILKDYDELVYIPMSSGLSSSCETAVMLAQDYGGRVQVVNNQRISVTLRQSALDAQALAAQWGGQAYPTWEALLADPAIDAVSICAANTAHAELTIAALRAGKHVLCEKPMATTLADCEAMAAAARESGRFLMIGQNQRLTKAHQKARQLVADGVLGDILTFRTTFGHGGPETWSVDPGKNTWFFDKSKAAMGAMADLGIHKTDLIQYLLGQTVVEATAKVTTLDKRGADGQLIGVDDNAICIYRMSGGAIGTMTASWTYYGAEDNSTVLYGTKGILRIYDDPAYSLKLITAGGEKVLYELEAIQTNDNQTASGVIDCFMDCLTGNTPPAISGESVLTAMRAVFACLESSRTGKSVSVAQN